MYTVSGTRTTAAPRAASRPQLSCSQVSRKQHAQRAAQRCPAARTGKRDGFWTGFALGGAMFGAVGFFFAPQISRAILNEQQKFRMPKWFEEDKPPVTKAELEEKINQLHSAINDVAASIGPESNDRSRVTTTGHSSKSNGSGNSSKVLDAISQ